ncbi:hypothetical protein LG943_08065 [Streptomonospora sp. S1-112]|uniref:Uncharacterized protein n=1 Tax=Streptomonospora mangrovi TaxID=2883123 RepID=A0A9X3NJR3_9ACTN|nr:hypothetical protein [Streptomonospora mangrovi]MDA0564280.1 hypothetical protein [Streptomonospora mangrovi]
MEASAEYPAVRLPEGSWWDWEVLDWDPVRLRLAAGHDLTYHHGLELVFHEPAYAACPAAFHDPVFRAPTVREAESAARWLGGRPPVLAAFDAEANGPEPVPCLIAAERLEIRHGIVLRHGAAGEGRPT